MKNYILLLLIFSSLISNAQIEDDIQITEEDVLRVKRTTVDNRPSQFTTTFYEIFLDAEIRKSYKLSERKKITLEISNWGCKEFYVPEWLSREFRELDELYFEILKENKKGKFILYKQKHEADMSGYNVNRKIFSLKDRQSYIYKDIEFDLLNKIREVGTYRITVYLDLSNFGYFKTLRRTTESFKVVD